MPEDDYYRLGKRRLRAWLSKAKAELRKESDTKFEPKSPLGNAMMTHLREDRIDAVVIYPAPLGGWHADVVFKGLPPGMPNTMGSPVGMPIPTFEDAEKTAYNTLLMVLRICEENKAAKREGAEPVFWLYDCVFTLSRPVLEKMRSLIPVASDTTRAIEMMDEVLSTHLPGVSEAEFSDRFKALTEEARRSIVTAVHMAAFNGLYRYPARTHGKPRYVTMEDLGEGS